jgi:hypothetical protein
VINYKEGQSMKKRLLVLLLIVFIAGTTTGVLAASDIQLIVNGKATNADVKIINGTSYVPLRVVSELLGASVHYDSNAKTITVTGNTSMITDDSSSIDPEYDQKVTEIEELRRLKVTGEYITLDARIHNLLIEIVIHSYEVESEEKYKQEIRNTMFPEGSMLTSDGKMFQSIANMLVSGQISDEDAYTKLEELYIKRNP